MHASDLYRFASPSKRGRLSPRDWVALEKTLGGLPSDFKDLVSAFGLGSFGDLILFHPDHKNQMFRLGPACEMGQEILRSQESPEIDRALADYPLVLGYVSPRRYLLHGNNSWLIIDSETARAQGIGPDMVKLLASEFESLNKGRVRHSLAPTVWKTAQDGTRSPFFIPYKT